MLATLILVVLKLVPFIILVNGYLKVHLLFAPRHGSHIAEQPRLEVYSDE